MKSKLITMRLIASFEATEHSPLFDTPSVDSKTSYMRRTRIRRIIPWVSTAIVPKIGGINPPPLISSQGLGGASRALECSPHRRDHVWIEVVLEGVAQV
jgi:hypothetical protein